MTTALRVLMSSAMVLCGVAAQMPPVAAGRVSPRIDGPWWTIAHNPELGALQSEGQQPVDFSIWQAKDGTWQLWSCIRGTACGGNSRLFYRWEGKRLTDPDWRPMGVAMQADPLLGEAAGGLQAPHVLREKDVFHMVYGDWQRICLMRSLDGKAFTRVLNERGQPDLFSGPFEGSRDPMLLRVGDLYHCYYTGHQASGRWNAAVFCRTSADLLRWSEPMTVCAGGEPARLGIPGVNAECPFVVERNGMFVLFRNLAYGAGASNVQYASRNPFRFGIDDDDDFVGYLGLAAPEIVLHEGRYYLACLLPGLDGIRVARLKWVDT